MHTYFKYFSIIGYYKIWNLILCAKQWALVVYLFYLY